MGRRVDCGDVFYPDPVTGVVVGTNPVWGDDSDATYADSTATGASGGAVDWPAAYVVNPSGSLSVPTLTIHLRAALLPGWDDARVGVYAGTTVGLGDNDLTSLIEPTATTQVSLTETPTDYTVASETPATFVNVLTGAWFATVVAQSINATARIYELWFEIGVPGSPPLRRYPRSDGLGVGPTRHYPPPQSRRLAGGIR